MGYSIYVQDVWYTMRIRSTENSSNADSMSSSILSNLQEITFPIFSLTFLPHFHRTTILTLIPLSCRELEIQRLLTTWISLGQESVPLTILGPSWRLRLNINRRLVKEIYSQRVHLGILIDKPPVIQIKTIRINYIPL